MTTRRERLAALYEAQPQEEPKRTWYLPRRSSKIHAKESCAGKYYLVAAGSTRTIATTRRTFCRSCCGNVVELPQLISDGYAE